jgi:hypothetical protein
VTEGIRTGEQSFRVLVRTRSGAIDGVLARLDMQRSARLVSSASRLPAVSATRPVLARLAADPDVERISSDAEVVSSGLTWTSTTTTTPRDNRLMRTLGMESWVPDGKEVVVAVIDSGVVAASCASSTACPTAIVTRQA